MMSLRDDAITETRVEAQAAPRMAATVERADLRNVGRNMTHSNACHSSPSRGPTGEFNSFVIVGPKLVFGQRHWNNNSGINFFGVLMYRK